MELTKIDFIKERVKELMKRSTTSKEEENPMWDLEEYQEDIIEYNVFEELFRTGDTDSKLILLNEVVAIGDEKEVRFLKRLLKNEEESMVIKLAHKCLKKLVLRLDTAKKESMEGKEQSSTNEQYTHSLPLKHAFLEQKTAKSLDVLDIPFDLDIQNNGDKAMV